MDPALIKEYGLAVFILIGASKGLQMLYKNMREDAKAQKEDTKEMFKMIQDGCKEREERIVEAMNKQTDTLQEMSDSIRENTTRVCNVERAVEELRREGA